MSTTMLLTGKRFPSLIGNKAYHDLTTAPKFEKSDPNEYFNYRWYTEAKLRWLTACIARDDCPENADKVGGAEAGVPLAVEMRAKSILTEPPRSSLSTRTTASGPSTTTTTVARACGASGSSGRGNARDTPCYMVAMLTGVSVGRDGLGRERH